MNPADFGAGIASFIMGYLFGKSIKKNNPTIHKLSHKCVPHSCNRHSASCACFEHDDGTYWVKEYGNPNESEGRTYRVNYCPWCGQMARSIMDLDFHCEKR